MSKIDSKIRKLLLQDVTSFRSNAEFISSREHYLRDAVDELDLELIEALLKARANPNLVDCQGADLLQRLCRNYATGQTSDETRLFKAIELLLKYGADPNRIGPDKRRAVDRCIEKNVENLINLLVKYGADEKLRDYI